jgi:hypothetical protein
MLIFLRILSLFVLLGAAFAAGTLWAKVVANILGGAGLFLFVLVPLPVLAGVFLLAYWIDGYLARVGRKQARYRRPPKD